MLVFAPKERLRAEQALAHEYLAPYHDPTDEPEADKFDSSFDDVDFPVDTWKTMMSVFTLPSSVRSPLVLTVGFQVFGNFGFSQYLTGTLMSKIPAVNLKKANRARHIKRY